MKRKTSLLLVMAMVIGLVACVTNPQVKEVVTEIAARRLAQHIAQTHPELVIPGTVICDKILGTNNKTIAQALLDEAISQATGKIAGGDPLLAKDIKSLVKLVNVDLSGGWVRDLNIDTSGFDMINLKIVAQAIKDGFNAPMLQYLEK